MRKVIFANHKEMQCGVHEYGLNVYNNIKHSKKFEVIYAEATTGAEFIEHLERHPDLYAIIYNFYPSTMSWLDKKVIKERSKHVKQFILVHETEVPECDGYIHLDPTYEEHDNHFKSVRPLMKYKGIYPKNDVLTVGSFGFGFGNKGFPEVVSKVNEEFDEARIRLLIPFAQFGDSDGKSAKSIATICRNIPLKPNVTLEISHDFLDTEGVLSFLASNDINAYFYHLSYGRGISSALDYSLSVKRPIAITRSYQFKHLEEYPIHIEDKSIKDILEQGIEPLKPIYKLWSRESLIENYEKILESNSR